MQHCQNGSIGEFGEGNVILMGWEQAVLLPSLWDGRFAEMG